MRRSHAIAISLCLLGIALLRSDVSLAQEKELQKYDRAITRVTELEKLPAATSGTDSLMGYLEFRDKRVAIIRGPKGTVYTVQTKDGKTLAAKIGEKALQSKFPALFNQIKNGVAGNDAALRQLPEKPAQTPSRY